RNAPHFIDGPGTLVLPGRNEQQSARPSGAHPALNDREHAPAINQSAHRSTHSGADRIEDGVGFNADTGCNNMTDETEGQVTPALSERERLLERNLGGRTVLVIFLSVIALVELLIIVRLATSPEQATATSAIATSRSHCPKRLPP